MSERTLVTGGARGSDHYWQEKASEHGIAVHVMSFEEHRPIKVPGAQVEVLSAEELKEADKTVRRANKRLKRRFPCKNEYDSNLIRRNYNIVKNATTVVAIGNIKDYEIEGGTAWGVVMADLMGKDTYCFDMRGLKWYKYRDDTFSRCGCPSLPKEGVFAGIGSRQLSEGGKCAIARVLESLNRA